MNTQEISEQVIATGLMKNPQVELLAEGEGNYNYLISEDEKKYVFRLKKSQESKDTLAKEYSFLLFAEHKGLDFLPKVIHFEEHFLIETYLVGQEQNIEELNNEQLDVFAKQLWQMYSLPKEEYYTFCKEKNIFCIPENSLYEAIDVPGFQRYETFKDRLLDDTVKQWIESHLDEAKTILESHESLNGFSWGDYQTSVIIGKQIYFFDFEHVNINGGIGLDYYKIHSNLSTEQFQYLLERYAHHSGISLERLEEEINTMSAIICTNDVVWAAMKCVETGEEKYKSLTYERMKKPPSF